MAVGYEYDQSTTVRLVSEFGSVELMTLNGDAAGLVTMTVVEHAMIEIPRRTGRNDRRRIWDDAKSSIERDCIDIYITMGSSQFGCKDY